MVTHLCSSSDCQFSTLIIIIVGCLTAIILLTMLIAILIKRQKNKQLLDQIPEIQEQHLWTPYSISSVINYPALESYLKTDSGEQV